MAKSRTAIQNKSDAKRGVRVKGFKLPIEFIAEFEQSAREANMTNNAFLMHLLALYKQQS